MKLQDLYQTERDAAVYRGCASRKAVNAHAMINCLLEVGMLLFSVQSGGMAVCYSPLFGNVAGQSGKGGKQKNYLLMEWITLLMPVLCILKYTQDDKSVDRGKAFDMSAD